MMNVKSAGERIAALVTEAHGSINERSHALLAISRVLDEFRRLNPNMPVSQIQAFLMVALEIGLGMTEISDATGIKNSTASRYLLELGQSRLQGDGSFELVDRGWDPSNTRKARYTLTRKGRRIVDDIVAYLTRKELP